MTYLRGGRAGKSEGNSPLRYASLAAQFVRRVREGQRAKLRPHAADDFAGVPNRARTVAVLQASLARRGRGRAFRRKVVRPALFSAAAVTLLAATWVLTREHRAGDIAHGADGHAAGTLAILGDNDAASHPSSGAVLTGHGPASLPATSGMTLQTGTGLVAPSTSEIHIGNGDGTVLTLEKKGELIVGEQTQIRRFSLIHGAVQARVAKLRPAQRFIISTEDAEVEVHGTVFRVALVPSDTACEGGIRTRVSVTEGVVSVRANGSEAFVQAGTVWPRSCPSRSVAETIDHEANAATRSAAAESARTPLHSHNADRRQTPPASPRVAVATASGADAAPQEMRTRAPTATPTGMSALAAQNDLFAAAIRAKRQGRTVESVRLFAELVNRYPDGPLTEGAMAQRMRVLATTDRGAARGAATEYLKRFPGGFAGGEARRLAGAAP